MGLLRLQKPLSSALSPKETPVTSSLEEGPSIPVWAQSPGQFSGKKVIPHFVPKTCLQVAPLLPFSHPSSAAKATLAPLLLEQPYKSCSQSHVASPGLHLFTLSPVWVLHSQTCPGPSPQVRPDSAHHGGQALAGPVGASFTPVGLGKMTLKIMHKEQKTLS